MIAKEACEGRSQNWGIGDFISYTLALLFQICYTGTKHIFLIFPAAPAVWRVLFISEDLCFSLIKT